MPVPMFLMDPNFLIELIYSIIIMVSCLVIYFKTREMYNLSSHKGIKYFSLAFLFFAVTYFLRFFSKILILSLMITGIRFLPREFDTLFSLLVLYAGFMTTFYLLYSISKKRLSNILPESTDILHVLAIFISSAVVILNLPMLFIGTSAILLFYMLIVVYSDYISSKKNKIQAGFLIVYFLLILFLMLNILDLFITFFGPIQTIMYIVSLSLFLLILYKVLKILSVESNGRKKKQA
jgi:hypothetical protein